jgi:hypothetical protein
LPSDAITIRTRLVGAKAAAAEARALGKGVSGIGTAAGRAEAKSRRFGRTQLGVSKSMGKVRGSVFGAAKGVLALGAAYVGASGIKSSVDTTEELARTTISLHKNLGLSVEKASEWAAVARSRDIDTKALNMSFGTLSKNIEGASKAGSTQAQIFDKLGVSQKTVASGDFNAVLGETADRLKAMGPGAKRTALTMKLFGRGWQTVVPLLRDGSSEMNQQLALARKYGATFHGHTIKSLNEFIQAQRESKIATMGLQIAVGTTLIPVLTKALGVFSRFVHQMRTGKGAGGQFAKTAKQIWEGMKPVVLWVGKATVKVAAFAAKHHNLVGIATAVFLVHHAFKRLGGGVIFSVVKQLGKLTARAAPIVARFGAWMLTRFGVIGTKAGGSFSKTASASAATKTGAWSAAGRTLGFALGTAAAAVIGYELGKALTDFGNKHPEIAQFIPGFQGTNPLDSTSLTKAGLRAQHQAERRAQAHSHPIGTTRRPNHKGALIAPRIAAPVGAGGGGDVVVPVTVMTPNGKVLGEAIGRATRDDRNRR